MEGTSSSLAECWDTVNQALGRGDAKGAAAAAQEGLRATPYDERKKFFAQLCGMLTQRIGTADGARCVAEVGELLWGMSEFRTSSAATSTISGEALLLAAAIAAAYAAQHNYEKALAFDRELLQSLAFFTYDGVSPLQRLACVARVLTAARHTGETRYADAAVHKGMSLYHTLTGQRERLNEAGQLSCDAVLRSYLYELALYRQGQGDFPRAFQAFYDLYESNNEAAALGRAALCALCIRAGDEVRQAALSAVLHGGSAAQLPTLYPHLRRAHQRQLFHAADRADVEAAADGLVPSSVLRDALREHNIVLLANAFDCVYWRSLCAHMDDADIQEGELYDLLVEMVSARRLAARIHQDTGYIEFGGGEAAAGQPVITDAEIFGRLAKTSRAIVAARPDLLA